MDASLPLQVKPIDTATPVNDYANNVMSDNTHLLQQQELKAQIAQTQFQHMDDVSKARLRSNIVGAALMKPYLDSGNVDGALGVLQRMSSDPIMGPDAKQMAGMLNSGGVEALKKHADDMSVAGKVLGIIPSDLKTVGYGEKLVDQTGHTIATGPDLNMGSLPAGPDGKPVTGDALLKAPVSPMTNHAIATQAIADGSVKMPYLRSAEARAVWEQTIADAKRRDPTANVNRTANMAKFDTGQQGNAIRTFSVAASHMDTLSKLADALNNGDTRALNALDNTFRSQFGDSAPTNFDTAKQFVADEVTKGILGTSGGVGDREQALQAVNTASSPAQLAGVINTWKTLMGGQLAGYKQQYEQTTGKKDFMNRISPAAAAMVPTEAPAGDAAGWKIERVQ